MPLADPTPASQSPGCACCAQLAALVHDLAAPACALQAAGGLLAAGAAPTDGAQRLLHDAIARLHAVWQQGRVGLARAGHPTPPRRPSPP